MKRLVLSIISSLAVACAVAYILYFEIMFYSSGFMTFAFYCFLLLGLLSIANIVFQLLLFKRKKEMQSPYAVCSGSLFRLSIIEIASVSSAFVLGGLLMVLLLSRIDPKILLYGIFGSSRDHASLLINAALYLVFAFLLERTLVFKPRGKWYHSAVYIIGEIMMLLAVTLCMRILLFNVLNPRRLGLTEEGVSILTSVYTLLSSYAGFGLYVIGKLCFLAKNRIGE